MLAHDWRAKDTALIKTLTDRIRNQQTCVELIDDYEDLMRSIWSFTTELVGDGGTQAIVGRSVRLAAQDVPLLQHVRVREGGVDFGGVRDHVASVDCDTPEVLDAVLWLGMTIFQTLTYLSGDTITRPLLHHLQMAD